MTLRQLSFFASISVFFGLAALSGPAAAAPDYASFESFYGQPWAASPWAWVIAAVAAIAAAVAILIFAPAAGPVATTIGTWIGSMFGFSGVAATNFGLALLGGGSIAAGGFGIVGGTALLTAALTFGTDIAFDYAAGTVVERYQYQRFVEASQTMTTLPLPRNPRGPKEYQSAFKILKSINPAIALSSPENRTLVVAAIEELPAVGSSARPRADAARNDSMLALLYFIADDYANARKYGNSALAQARRVQMKAPVASFIVAASSLYEESVDVSRTIEYFRESIHAEPDNPLSTLLFAVFLDRLMYRLNDGTLSAKDLAAVARVADMAALKESRAPIQILLLARHLMRLKLEQQKISSLTQTFNTSIRSSPRTLDAVKISLGEYEQLLSAAELLIDALSTARALEQPGVPEEMKNARQLIASYADDLRRLERLIESLESFQSCIATPPIPSPRLTSLQSARIGQLLGEAGLYYEVDEDCVFGITYAVAADRIQVVWIGGTSEIFDDLPIWRVWSMAAEVSQSPSPELMFRALTQNSEMAVGAWELVSDDSKYLLMLKALVVGDDMSSDQLSAVLEAVMAAADEMEKSLADEDQF